MNSRPPVLVSLGDPNGIGPEIAVKAAVALWDNPDLRPVLVGDHYIVAPLVKSAEFNLVTNPAEWGRMNKSVDLHAVAHMPESDYAPGNICAAAGQATVACTQSALELFQAGKGRGLVACPHSETAVNASGRVFSGYPNLLSELLKTGPDSVFLMLIGGGLKITHVTLHEGISTALARLTPKLIEKAVTTTVDALRLTGVTDPHIGVFGINPHAGENGLFGDEDIRITMPAIENLRAKGINVSGPEGADTMLAHEGYDAFVCMYHDQGHIPVKLLAGRNIAAMSIGANILFSSVGHGAGFDIAGQNKASADGVLRAIKLIGKAT